MHQVEGRSLSQSLVTIIGPVGEGYISRANPFELEPLDQPSVIHLSERAHKENLSPLFSGLTGNYCPALRYFLESPALPGLLPEQTLQDYEQTHREELSRLLKEAFTEYLPEDRDDTFFGAFYPLCFLRHFDLEEARAIQDSYPGTSVDMGSLIDYWKARNYPVRGEFQYERGLNVQVPVVTIARPVRLVVQSIVRLNDPQLFVALHEKALTYNLQRLNPYTDPVILAPRLLREALYHLVNSLIGQDISTIQEAIDQLLNEFKNPTTMGNLLNLLHFDRGLRQEGDIPPDIYQYIYQHIYKKIPSRCRTNKRTGQRKS